MKKTILSLVTFLSMYTIVTAQSIDDGKKFLYYERLTSAKQVFEKLASGNKDAEAVYWLGQAYLDADQFDSAKAIYQNALTAGLNDPWIWIGSAHVDVLQGGDINAAKQKFEQAITATTKTKGRNKGPNADILNAIGRAMADGPSTVGDPNYGIDKLKQAASIDPQNPGIFINLGKCYLKLGGDHGGEAFEAFRQSTVINPQFALGYYRIGLIYQSQRNQESMNEWYGKAINADPTFAPVYLKYFQYYSETDVTAAKEYLDKYIANADKDCKTEFFVGDYLFRAGKYQESLAKAKEMESGSCKDYPSISILYAYNYDRLGDSVQAKSYIQKYFAVASPDALQPGDYAFAGSIFAKFPGGEDSAIAYLQKAVDLDTVKDEQLKYLITAGKIAAASANYRKQLAIVKKMETINAGKLSETEYFNLAKAITDAKEADSSKTFDSTKYLIGDSVIMLYVNAYPDKPQGYSFRTRFAKMSDVDSTRGLAVEPIEQYNEFLAKNASDEDNKKSMFANYYYLLLYYAQYATDVPKEQEYQRAIDVTEKMKAIYPDPNSDEYKFADGTGKSLQSSLDKFNKSKAANGSGSGKSQK